MKTLINNNGHEFQVTDVLFEKVKKSFIDDFYWMLIIKDVTGNAHTILESDNRERIFYQRNYR